MTEVPEQDGGKFVLDKDQLESLRLESDLPPEKIVKLREVVAEAYSIVLDKFGEYIDNPIGSGEIEDRFIFLDEDTYLEFMGNWNKSMGASYTKSIDESAMRAYMVYGEFVIVNSGFSDIWNLLSGDTRSSLIDRVGGDEERAISFANDAMNLNRFTHEITHLHQNANVPLWLIESQAYWSGRELIGEERRVSALGYDKIADFYQSLLDKYGEDKIHGICLSKGDNENYDQPLLYWDLDSEFTPKIQKEIFPDYKEA